MKSKAMEKVFSMYNWDVITYHTLNVYKEITGIKITKQ